MPDILNPSERAEFYKILANNITIKIATIHSNEYLNYYIENNLAISPDITPDKVDAVIGLVFNTQTSALTRLCYFKEIGEEDEELQSRETSQESKPKPVKVEI